MTVTRRAFALGGGGFSSAADRGRLDAFACRLTGRAEPSICFVPTASGDSAEYIAQFYARFTRRRARLSHLGLFRLTVPDPAAHLAEQDLIYLGGGSAVNLMAVLRAHRLDEALRVAYDNGALLVGVSAGALALFTTGVTLSSGVPQPFTDGLGLLAGSFCPHASSDPALVAAYREFVGAGKIDQGYVADDGVGLYFEDGRHVSTVSEIPGNGAFQVIRDDSGGTATVPLPTLDGKAERPA